MISGLHALDIFCVDAISKSKHQIEGTISLGSQYHFHMETQVCTCIHMYIYITNTHFRLLYQNHVIVCVECIFMSVCLQIICCSSLIPCRPHL